MIKINHDTLTGEITEIPFTEAEIAAVELDKIRFAKIAEKNEAEAEAAAAAKAAAQAKLAALGLTVEDLQALGL